MNVTMFGLDFDTALLTGLTRQGIMYVTVNSTGTVRGWCNEPIVGKDVWHKLDGDNLSEWIADHQTNVGRVTWDQGYWKHIGPEIHQWEYCKVRPSNVGNKWDENKARWDLLPFHQVEEVVLVLTHGAQKYGPDNWRKVPNAKNRYFAAMMRHITSYRNGEIYDEESTLTHLSHAMCCMLFLMELEGERDEDL